VADLNENVDVSDSGLAGVDGERHWQTGKHSSRFYAITVDLHFTGVVTNTTCFHLYTTDVRSNGCRNSCANWLLRHRLLISPVQSNDP